MVNVEKLGDASYDQIPWYFSLDSKTSPSRQGRPSVGSPSYGVLIVKKRLVMSTVHDVFGNVGRVHKMTDSPTDFNLIPLKFQSAYKEITGRNVNWNDIPLNLRRSFLTSKPLSGQEFIELPRNFGIAYLAFRKPSDDVILDKIKKRIVSYEEKYGISSSDFYNKYHNSEAIFDGSQGRTLDFLMWLSNYEEYSELENVSRQHSNI